MVGGAGRMSDSRVGVGDELVMRTFRCNAPIIIGAGALVFLSVAPAPSFLKAEERQAEAAVSENRRARPSSGGDRIVALKALELALSELGDGVDARMAAAGARAGRPGQAGIGLPRRQGPHLPHRRLRARARRLSAGNRRRCLPGARRLLVALGVKRSLCMSNVSGTFSHSSPISAPGRETSGANSQIGARDLRRFSRAAKHGSP